MNFFLKIICYLVSIGREKQLLISFPVYESLGWVEFDQIYRITVWWDKEQTGELPDDLVDYVLRPWRCAGPRIPMQHMAEVHRVDGDIDRSRKEGAERCVNK